MSDLEYLFEYIKQCHDAKDIVEMKDIVCDLEQLEQFYQQGNQNAIVQLVQRVVAKHLSFVSEIRPALNCPEFIASVSSMFPK